MLFDKAQRKLWRYGLVRCEHRDSRHVMITTASGARGVREQCLTCGYLDSAPWRLAEFQTAPPADLHAAAHWETNRREAGLAAQLDAQKRHAIRRAAKPAEDADWWQAYDEYLHSDRWQAARQAVLRRDSGRCQAALPGCTREAVQVHHDGARAYAYHNRLGSTPLFLLHAVCVSCHRAITEADRAERGSK